MSWISASPAESRATDAPGPGTRFGRDSRGQGLREKPWIALGLGGLAGGYLGATAQERVSEQLLRRVLGLLAFGLGLRYGVVAMT